MIGTSKRSKSFTIFLAAFINSLGGIGIDLYAPSIPAIGRALHTSQAVMLSTITVFLLAYALGQLFFGLFSDTKGRKPAVLTGLLAFIAGSVLATQAHRIETLMVARALQGFAIGSCQVVARAMLVDNFKGDRFRVAIIYLSLAFGLGPVIAPYIGGLVEDFVGWRWNFAIYCVYGVTVLLFVLFGMRESFDVSKRQTLRYALLGYGEILSNREFFLSVILLGGSFSAFLMWNILGPYLIQVELGHSASFFGTTALICGTSYLLGTLINRMVTPHFKSMPIMKSGILLFLLGVVCMIASGSGVQIYPIMAGVIWVAFAQGFIFPNAMARSMGIFAHRASVAASLQGFLMLVIGSISSGLASLVRIDSGFQIAAIFGCLLGIEVLALRLLDNPRMTALS